MIQSLTTNPAYFALAATAVVMTSAMLSILWNHLARRGFFAKKPDVK